MSARQSKKLVTTLAGLAAGSVILGGGGGYYYLRRKSSRNVLHAATVPENWITNLPSREEQVEAMSKEPEYDILVIGGGATGAGVAVDAAVRGLKTALVEKYDFSSGTSSRSTKLIHGGVRYLQKAIMEFDLEQVNYSTTT